MKILASLSLSALCMFAVCCNSNPGANNITDSTSTIASTDTVAGSGSTAGFKIGIQMWTFRMFSFADALNKVDSAGVKNIEAFFGQELGGDMRGDFGTEMSADTRAILKQLLQSKGMPANFGDDIGGDEETVIANSYDRPVIITRYPAAIKAFYMQPAPEDPTLALGMDMIAPEGYGEIIGGSQRIHDHDLLLQRIQEHGLPVDRFQWYLDVRKYGTFPHSGFGMGIERMVAWISGVPHLRETIPYPRMINRIYP